ncbi:hypothetical protein [Streptomyces wuyuanensis]|uniref:hypothetical protein n=1 Tax=Streptomyces wuyuanensis TaxID=1196353 RepID=UPI00342DCCFD
MSVVHVIRTFQDELEADLREFFSVDLLDLWRGRLSIRQVGVFIKSLLRKPGRSTLLMALDERAAWSEPDYMMARISDALELSNFLFLKANFEAGDLEKPDPIPRPGNPEPVSTQPEVNSAKDVIDFFGQMNSL